MKFAIKDTVNILFNSSMFIQFFAGMIFVCTLALTAALMTDYLGWWKFFAVCLFLSNLALLCEFVDDRRICSDEEREEWMLKNQAQ